MLQRFSMAAFVLALCLGASAQTDVNADMWKAIAAIKAGKVNELEALLQSRPELVSVPDPEYGATLLHWAAALKDAEAVDLLIKYSASREARNKEEATPLQVAIVPNPGKPGGAGLLDLVKKLSTREVVKMANVDGKTALHLACQYNQLEVARFLIEDMGADVNARTDAGKLPLDYAREAKNLKLVELLNAEKPEQTRLTPQPTPTPTPTPTPPAATADNVVALRAAAAAGDLGAVRHILRKNPTWIDRRYEFDQTLLHLAAKNRKWDVIAELIKAGANINLKDSQGHTFWDLLCTVPAK